MLLFETPKRLSIDIDIICAQDIVFDPIIENIKKRKGFINVRKITRNTSTSIKKEHYKFYYVSALSGREDFILLDVLKEERHYTNTISAPVKSMFVKDDGEPLYVTIPDHGNLLGDKLTAFAPNTTGIPYYKNGERGMEIIKQLYDIKCLFDEVENLESVSDVFSSFAKTELSYRNEEKLIEEVLDDIIHTALSICLDDNDLNPDLIVLKNGIKQIPAYIFSERFNHIAATTAAAKTAYIASIIKSGKTEITKFNNNDMKNRKISGPLDTKVTRTLKRSNPEAFYYIFMVSLLLNEETFLHL